MTLLLIEGGLRHGEQLSLRFLDDLEGKEIGDSLIVRKCLTKG